MLVLLGSLGCCGALLMFVADLILYLPAETTLQSAECYFDKIDPNGANLAMSPMAQISDARLALGGVLGPIAATLYGLGFAQLYFGLNPNDRGSAGPAVAFAGLTLMMVLGGVYHALFVYTGLIARALQTTTATTTNFVAKTDSMTEGSALSSTLLSQSSVLGDLLEQHRKYIRFVYKWAAVAGFAGSVAYIATCLSRETMYPKWTVAFTPMFSAPLKLFLKRRRVGGLVLCGGLTNLWNLIFLATVTICVAERN